jgi:DNA polymerase-4
VARRLRRSGYAGLTVTLKIKLGTARRRREARVGEGDEPVYPLLTRSKTLREATDDGAKIRAVALELWDAAAIREPVRLLGVSVSQLSPSAQSQLELFAPSRPKRELGRALDAIRERFGRNAIGPAVDSFEKVTPTLRKKRGE